jgi:membrane protease subunit HflK
MNPQDPNVTPPVGGPPPADDAGSQALAEALRSSFVIVQIIMVALVLVFLSSGFFTIGPQEKGVVLRLGKPVGGGQLLGPGAHWAWPAPIDEVVRLHITSVTRAESSVGWYQTAQERAAGAPEPPPLPKLSPANITYALTSDTNIIHVWAAAQYTVTDPITFNFTFSDAPSLITNALNNALLRASSEFTVDGILTSNRAEFKERVQQLANEEVESEHLGIALGEVIPFSSPPLSLRDKFRDVDKAVQKQLSTLASAKTYENTNLAWARGESDTRVKVADAARKRKVDMMAAQADIFPKLLAQYERNPELFKRIRQMAVLADIYTNAQEKIVVPPNSREYRFQLNREPQAPSVSNIPTTP